MSTSPALLFLFQSSMLKSAFLSSWKQKWKNLDLQILNAKSSASLRASTDYNTQQINTGEATRLANNILKGKIWQFGHGTITNIPKARKLNKGTEKYGKAIR